MSSYSYDSLNRLTGLANTDSGSFGFGYDALGRRTFLTRPNGVNTSYSYDTLSRLLSVLHNGGALPGSASYTYDAAGNRLTKTAVQEASPNPVSVLSQYSYDNIYELTQAVVNSSVAESYSYDAVGNRLTSAGPTSYNYNASNELTSTSAATYAYDNNGNTVSKTTTAGTTSYAWDFENRLASVTLPGTGGTVNFKYDPFGRRIEKIAPTTGTTVYAYDGANVTAELGAGGNLLAYYTQGAGIDEPLAIAGTGGTSYYHSDGLGSITSVTNGSAQLAASYVYDSFGNLTASTGTITNPFQYTARESDSETGLYHYRARYYDVVNGRFVSEDRLKGISSGLDFYRYVRNDVVNLIDPSGLSSQCPCNTTSSFRLVPISDCSTPGYRRIVYELRGPGASNWWVTEHQNPTQWAPSTPGLPQGQSVGNQAGVFDDTIWGWNVGNSLQTFSVSSKGPRTDPNTPTCQVNVQLPSGPNGQPQDYGTLGMWHGGFTGSMFINGNSTGWVPCNPSYGVPGSE
ncbi:MAG: RHS repeat-associated core domain-containing protein [Terriglobia bacterium]